MILINARWLRLLCLILLVSCALCCCALAVDDEEIDTENATSVTSTETSDGTQVNVFVVDNNIGDGTSLTGGSEEDTLIEELFGPYTPYNAAGVASIDFGWIANVAIFAILLVCLFRVLGGIIKNV